MKKIITWTFIIIWMFGIFYFSNMDNKSSNEKSKNVIEKTIDITNTIVNDNTNKVEKKVIVNKMNYPFRKLSHILEYLILGILLFYGLYLINKKILISLIICLLIGITYASLDEYHQTFIPGRSGRIVDVCYDTLGLIIGCSSISIYKKHKSIQEE